MLINEVGWAGTDAYHSDLWLELWNPDPRCPIKLQDWYLKGDSGWTVNFTSADGSIGPGDYYVITHYFDAFQNLKPDKFDSGLSLDYSGEVVYLYGSHKELVDTANCNSTDTSHCAGGSWPAGQYSPHAVSMERRGNLVDNSEAWMTYDGSFDPGSGTLDAGTHRVRGTPRQKNWAFDRAAPVPTATERVRKPTAIPPTPFAHMVINEFLPRAGTDWNQDGSVDVYDEFIELKNLGPIDVDLSDWILDNGPNTSSSPYRLPSQTLKPGERALFYGLKTHILLPDSGGLVRLVNPDGVIFDARGYGPVAAPDQSTCRIPDGFYWRLGCFPTPGLENSLRGVSAAPPPVAALKPPPCLLADSVPEPFREAECAPFGADIWNGQYWDDQAGQSEIPVQDIYSKWWTIIK